MGSLVGHVAPGLGFFVIGLWHLFNHIKLHLLHPSTYKSLPWFPSPRFRYLELYLIILGSCASVAMELFIGPRRHQPLDTDGSIPSNHLHNFEHSSISSALIIYGVFAILLDKMKPKSQLGLTQLLGALAFAQELFLFHLHSTDHTGVEGQYHTLLQIVIFVSLLTTLMGIGQPDSFLISFVRSVSIVFQGAWLMTMGVMLWTPSLIPKGCFMNLEEGHNVVRCRDDHSLHRAKSIVNIEFSWFLISLAISVMSMYLGMMGIYGEKSACCTTVRSKEVDEGLQHELEMSSSSSGTGSDEDLESQKGADSHVDERKSFIHGKIKKEEK
uniref:Transmembrane protein 45A n=1 Tax=Kalanchoe fedtschenkoi TaxID=63787 RepID=A0A7N0T8W7_KALFE